MESGGVSGIGWAALTTLSCTQGHATASKASELDHQTFDLSQRQLLGVFDGVYREKVAAEEGNDTLE